MSVVTDLLDDPQQILLKAATPVCRRHLQQEEGEQQRKQQTFRRQQQREKYNRDQREQQQEQQSRFMECRDAKKGLRVRATKKGAAWPPVMGIGSDVASLWSCATPVMTTRSPHNSLDESQPVSATSTEPSIVSEGAFGCGIYMHGNQTQGETVVVDVCVCASLGRFPRRGWSITIAYPCRCCCVVWACRCRAMHE